MTLSQAAKKYKRNHSTLRAAIWNGRLIAEKDELTGTLWTVTDESMQTWLADDLLHTVGAKKAKPKTNRT